MAHPISRAARNTVLAFSAGVVLTSAVAGAANNVLHVNGDQVSAVRTALIDGPAPATNSTTPLKLMGLGVFVPAGAKAVLVITVSGASVCTDPTHSYGSCYLRVLVDGVDPTNYGAYEFDTVGGSREEQSFQRVSPVLQTGPHTVVVQQYVGATTTSFQVVDPVLTVLRVNA
jgi:hypothetical protein